MTFSSANNPVFVTRNLAKENLSDAHHPEKLEVECPEGQIVGDIK